METDIFNSSSLEPWTSMIVANGTPNITGPFVPSTIDIVIGTTYMTEAVIFIFLHILCSYLMYTDEEMQNPTYYFMIGLSIVDVVELSMIGIYAGIIILTGWYDETVARWAGFLTIGVWYSNCVLFALIAFARWVAITRPHMTLVIFRRSIMWTMQALSWIVMNVVCFYGDVLYPPGPMFQFIPTYYTWDFDQKLELGRIFTYVNLIFNATCTFFEMGFNIMSLYWVHKTRKQVQSFTTAQNRRREIKLLLQCFILGCVFTATYIIFTTVSAFPQLVTVPLGLCVQGVWTLNHSVNPMVYLLVNKKLRRRTIKFLTCGKFGGNTISDGTTIVRFTSAQSMEQSAV